MGSDIFIQTRRPRRHHLRLIEAQRLVRRAFSCSSPQTEADYEYLEIRLPSQLMGLKMKEHFRASFQIRLSGAVVSLTLAAQSFLAANAQLPQDDPSIQAKIASALSAGPEQITKDATIAEVDTAGTMHVLRSGSNGWICMPGDPNSVANPPMCEDKPSQEWDYAFRHHLPKPTNTVPGITFMLAGAEQRSDSDPNDKTSPPIKIGPHWMIMWPFDPKTTGLPTHHKPTGAYIMWAETPYAHVHVMGRP